MEENNKNNYKPIVSITDDGSHTLFIPGMDEHYHSVNGAEQESRHVYIGAGFNQCVDKENIKIFEAGFGTGLNAFLTMLEAERQKKNIIYHTVELYPLSRDIIRQLNYGKINSFENEYQKLHRVEWGKDIVITPYFTIRKIEIDLNLYNFTELYDLIYFDAFAPDKQAALWNKELFEKLYDHSVPGGILTTYCAKGWVRRMLQEVGYKVERLPGPPGKREILRARK